MVVLEGGGIISSGGNQYLQPDYLSPLPTTLDAKKSPLALLAQTCSQIGADSPSAKTLLSSVDKKKSETARSSPNRDKNEKNSQRSTPSETKLISSFKPYETNVVSRKSEEIRPSSKSSVNNDQDKRSPVSDRKSVSPNNINNNNVSDSNTSVSESEKISEISKMSSPSTSPIIRSGLEILQGNTTKDTLGAFKPGSLSYPLGFPPGFEHGNPAFRPPFAGAPFSNHQASMFGYPSSSPTPYLSYARVKTPSGGEALVPVCKDPYCTGCQFSLQNQQLLLNSAASAACPSGCTQCDHQKYSMAMAMSLNAQSSLAYSQLGRPYVCNWIAGDSYCGKRFVTSEELLQHLRTHTSGADSNNSSTSNLLNHSLLTAAALHRTGFSNPPLSPLSARYHPYGKLPMPSGLAPSPYSAFNPTTLGSYYSPYSIYGQRIGAAAVHP